VLAKALSCAVIGLDSSLVEVEVDLSPGLPSFHNVEDPELEDLVRTETLNLG
jgi:hypothetical protein